MNVGDRVFVDGLAKTKQKVRTRVVRPHKVLIRG